MPKVSIISPMVFLRKVSQTLKQGLKKPSPDADSEEEALFSASLPATIDGIPSELPISPNKFQVSLHDLKLVSTSLSHFEKYLKAKGQKNRAGEISEIRDRVMEFIIHTEEHRERENE